MRAMTPCGWNWGLICLFESPGHGLEGSTTASISVDTTPSFEHVELNRCMLQLNML